VPGVLYVAFPVAAITCRCQRGVRTVSERTGVIRSTDALFWALDALVERSRLTAAEKSFDQTS
jgi:hypothetical protein